MIDLDSSNGELRLREYDPNECLILYGSYARGDHNAASDVDVLRVGHQRALRESIDDSITLHTYTLADLRRMASDGSLFVLHLLREGRALHDPNGTMEKLETAFRRPVSYVGTARRRLSHAVRLLDIDEALFAQAPREFLATAAFICRSMVYATHAEGDAFSFSLRTLALRDEDAALLLWAKQAAPTYVTFRRLRRAARTYFSNEPDRVEARSMAELAALGTDGAFDGLLRRILSRITADPYDAASSLPTSALAAEADHRCRVDL
jgi:hypothetical protein